MKLKKRINKHHIPSLFTLLNMFLGFLAIISVVEGNYPRAAYLIVGAAIFDALDGKLARWIQRPSQFGMELDSLADVISFCLAPALLIWALYAPDLHPVLGGLIAGAPLYFGALRLARHNVGQRSKPQSYFEGLPSPANALVIVALVFYYYGQGQSAAKVVLPIIMATSFLMISPIRYAKTPRLTLRAGLGNTLYLAAIIATLISLPIFGGRIVLPIVLAYVLSGLVRWLTRADSTTELHSVEEEA
ncbi:MAG: CDP-diacylglycerol--serine O-phosphatidyltransferase [Fidelibacterota bacterium]|nr:MAG: CDP-diacylglycerol--serine O-phosphatidyltransferase [Candidatus Neomarinimicrobiota bacterium]